MKRCCIVLVVAVVLIFDCRARGAEGGTGLYLPGYFGLMAGYVPPATGFYVNNDAYFYTAKASLVPSGSSVSVNVRANIALDIPSLTWVSPFKVFGAEYAAGIAQPFGYVHMDAQFAPLGIDQGADTFGLADTAITPMILGWHFGDLHVSTLFNVYAPTGQYNEDQAINLSKHFWAMEPMANATYFNPKIGLELSAALGFTVNFENPTTHYRSGNVFHADVGIGQYLSKQLKVGVVSYAWIQITGDSGAGATLGAFRSEVFGVGPAIDYAAKIGDTDVDFQLKWYHEFDANNRLEGDGFYLNLTFGL